MSVSDPYLSPAVRSVIEHPDPDASIRLRLTLTSGTSPEDTPDLATAIRAADGSIDRALPFDGLEVTIPQTRVETLVDVDDISAIETTATLSITGDAGEDVRLNTDE